MEINEEYHDPDYPGVPVCVKEEVPSLTEDEKIEKIKQIVRREFRRELDAREDEVALIDQRMTKARRYLHKLRYALVLNYYTEQRLQLSSSQIEDEVAAQSQPRARIEVASILRDSQRNVHPSVRKLLGRKTVDMEEIFRSREPRKKSRVDYSAMVQAKNVTISADTTKTLRPVSDEPTPEEPSSSSAPPRKVPRHLEPKVENVLTLEGVTRNKQKHRYRIIVGNTSKYMPPASRADRSTHKWLLYVRGPPLQPDVSRVITAVTVRLHHSYAPHHIVVIDKPPFQVSRRGWGEFPAKLTLQFTMPDCNRPATLEHTIKLDRNYTGLQTLGAETIVDVWLYSTPEMLPFEYKTEHEPTVKPDEQCDTPMKDIKTEPQSDENEEISEISQEIGEVSEKISDNKGIETDEWLNFFTNDSTEVNVDEMFVKNVKKEKLPELEVNKGNQILANDSQVNQTLTKDAKVSQAMRNDNKTQQIVGMNHKVGQTLAKDDVNTTVTKDSKYKQSMENDGRVNVKIEPMDDPITNGEHENNEFVEKPKELNSKRIVKYMDPNTRKIYYLEVDRALDLNKIQEIVIDSQGQMKKAKVSPKKVNLNNGLRFVRKKKGESLLKPEIQNELVKKSDNPTQNQSNQIIISNGYDHIKNDHCYLANDWCMQADTEPKIEMKKDYVHEIRLKITKLTCPRVIVSYLLKHIPVISGDVKDPDFVRSFPFVVGSHEKYWKLDFAKRRNIEWSRAKLINRILEEKFKNDTDKVWETKSILVFSRLHGYYPVRPEITRVRPEKNVSESNDWSSWNDLENSRKSECNIRELYPNPSSLCSLRVFKTDSDIFVKDDSFEDICDSDEDIDVVSEVKPVRVKSEVVSECRDDLTVLPVNSEDRHKFLFIERMCADMGIELRNEDIGNGYSYSAVHGVLLTAMQCFAEELVRAGLADQLAFCNDPHLPSVWTGSSSRIALRLEHVFRGLKRAPRLRLLRAAGRPAAARAEKL